MATNFNTPNAGLTVPIPGLEPGPQYATDLSNNMIIIDGYLAPATPSRLNINGDLTFQDNNATNLRSTRYINQVGLLTGAADINCLYVDGGNLYYNNASGTPIALTQGGGVTPAGFTAYTVQVVNTASWTILPTDLYNLLEVAYTVTGAVTINLPASSLSPKGRFYIIKDAVGNAATHNITINVNAATLDTIEGQTSYVISGNYGEVILWTDATGTWYTLTDKINISATGQITLAPGSLINGNINFIKSAATPTLGQQAPSTDVAAGTLTIQAADGYSAASVNQNGGNLVLSTGNHATGGGSLGQVTLQLGHGLSAVPVWKTNGTTIDQFFPIVYDATIATGIVGILHADSTITTCAEMVVAAQSSAAGSSTGGNLILSSGSGTSNNGYVEIEVGNETALVASTVNPAGAVTTQLPGGYGFQTGEGTSAGGGQLRTILRSTHILTSSGTGANTFVVPMCAAPPNGSLFVCKVVWSARDSTLGHCVFGEAWGDGYTTGSVSTLLNSNTLWGSTAVAVTVDGASANIGITYTPPLSTTQWWQFDIYLMLQ